MVAYTIRISSLWQRFSDLDRTPHPAPSQGKNLLNSYQINSSTDQKFDVENMHELIEKPELQTG